MSRQNQPKQTLCHLRTVLFHPRCSLFKCRGKIDLKQPRIIVVVDHDVETDELEATLLLDKWLFRFLESAKAYCLDFLSEFFEDTLIVDQLGKGILRDYRLLFALEEHFVLAVVCQMSIGLVKL